MVDLKNFYIELGKKIKELRVEHNLTQEQLANALNLQRTSITNIEAGNQAAPLHVYYQACVLFKENLGDLLPANSTWDTCKVEGVTNEKDVASLSPKLFDAVRKISQKLEAHTV